MVTRINSYCVWYIDGLAQRKEFPRAYEKLCEGRTAMDKAQRKYNRTAALFEEYLQLHREANAQLTQLKERCIEVSSGWCF